MAVVAATRWAWVLIANAGRGLDVSDEAYYLLSAWRPSTTRATASDFGFYLRPVLWLSGGSLRWFRVAGMVLVLVACAGAAFAAITGSDSDRRTSKSQRAAALLGATALVSATTLTYYGRWLPTPSYNLLNLVLMLLVAGCLTAGSRTLAQLHETGIAVAGPRLRDLWPLSALGALLVFGSTIKASSYLAATLVCAVCLAVVAGRHVVPAVRAAFVGAVAGLVVHWGLIAGAPASDLRRLRRGVEALGLLESHSASQVWETDFLVDTVAPWFAVWGLGVLLIVAVWRVVRSPAVRSLVVVSSASLTFVLMWDGRPRGGAALLSDATGWWWVRLGAVTLVWISALAPRPSRLLVVGPCVALLGVAASVGSNIGVVRQIGMSAGVIGLGVLIQAVGVVGMMDRSHIRSLAAVPGALFFVLASVASSGAVDDALADPYRLGAPLAESNERIELGRFGPVEVTPSLASYFTGLQALSGELSDEQRGCLIDLTGGTPISAIALDARPAGFAWLLGGYAGSADAADYWLSLDDCVTGPITLLEAPGGERSIRRPPWLSERSFRVVGEVAFNGYLDELQVLSVTTDNGDGE
ncbi:MAG: hypothetical protein AB7Q42_01055 [Acidimicrobiia bacterium]